MSNLRQNKHFQMRNSKTCPSFTAFSRKLLKNVLHKYKAVEEEGKPRIPARGTYHGHSNLTPRVRQRAPR